MSDRPLVSVCIPAYNHEKYVADCIESVLKQTVSDFEIVITDDCSSDSTASVIESFSDNRIRLFRSERNRGPSATANNNLRQARGEYVCFLASDDIFHPKKLEQQLAYLGANPDVGVVFSYMRYVDEEGAPLANHLGYRYTDVANRSREAWLRSFFLEGNSLCAPTAMMRREVYEKVGWLDNRLLQTQDFDFWIRVCLHFGIYVLPDRLVDYRVRANQQNTSATTPEKQAQTYWELSKVLQHFCQINDESLFYRIFPEVRHLEGRSFPIPILVALVALKAEARSARVFGLELLYSMLADDRHIRLLEEIGCDLPTFYNLIKEVDVFGVRSLAKTLEAEARALERISSLKGEYDWAVDQAQRWEAQAAEAVKRAQHCRNEHQQALNQILDYKEKYNQTLRQAHMWERRYKESRLGSRVRRLLSKFQRSL